MPWCGNNAPLTAMPGLRRASPTFERNRTSVVLQGQATNDQPGCYSRVRRVLSSEPRWLRLPGEDHRSGRHLFPSRLSCNAGKSGHFRPISHIRCRLGRGTLIDGPSSVLSFMAPQGNGNAGRVPGNTAIAKNNVALPRVPGPVAAVPPQPDLGRARLRHGLPVRDGGRDGSGARYWPDTFVVGGNGGYESPEPWRRSLPVMFRRGCAARKWACLQVWTASAGPCQSASGRSTPGLTPPVRGLRS